MSIKCTQKRWVYLLVALVLIIIGLVVVGVYFWINNGNNDAENTTRPEVNILQGTLRGVNMATYFGRSIFGFKGIPYAQPPIGDLRFKEPELADAWNGTLDAGSDSNECPQLMNGEVLGDEDCLYINVYTPRLPTSENSTLLPVLIYIHGGGFDGGSNSADRFGPHFLLDKDVVLVVPNYRLGVLGFLSTGDEVAPGNWGLKDLVQALAWNRDNIQYFGGDPNQVTIFGQSAGAMSVHLMAFSNLTSGLYHRYITDSGTALTYDVQTPKELLANRTIRLGNYLGCATDSSIALVNCIRGLNASQLVDTTSLFTVWNDYPKVIWGPTIESDVEGAFLTDRPANLIAAGKMHDLPWLSSVNRDEGIGYAGQFYNAPDLFQDFLTDIDVALPSMLMYDTIVDNVTAYTAALKSYYLNDLTADRALLLTNFTKLMGDGVFGYPAYSANQQQLVNTESSQYFCSFEYQGTFSWTYLFGGGSTEHYGVAHNDELIYLFEQPYAMLAPSGSEMNENDWKMVDMMVQLWTSFASTGMPTTADLGNNMIWEPYSSSRNHLRIGNNSDTLLEVEYDFLEDRVQFWEELNAATSWL